MTVSMNSWASVGANDTAGHLFRRAFHRLLAKSFTTTQPNRCDARCKRSRQALLALILIICSINIDCSVQIDQLRPRHGGIEVLA